MVYTNSLRSCRTTYDLGSQEIRKYQESVQTPNDTQCPAPPPRQKKKFPNTSKKAPEKWRANPPPPAMHHPRAKPDPAPNTKYPTTDRSQQDTQWKYTHPKLTTMT